jgi:esterase/lipase superfamily enzyme
MMKREVDPELATTVRVYYGTNREIAQQPVRWQRAIRMWAGVLGLAAVVSLWWFVRSIRAVGSQSRKLLRRVVVACGLLGVVVWSAMQCNTAYQGMTSSRQGVRFGGHRSPDRAIHYGYCDVSIPPTHSLGKVERPLLGPEDEKKHVVLKRVALLEEPAFYDVINQVLDEAGDTSRDALLYVHGYNVAFDAAAMRAAQIDHDLKFAGTTMFYSWPSRGSFRHYFSDRNEIQFSHRLLKEFLSGVLANIDVDRFHIIAHSMGADALCRAIDELDPEGETFDQVILAAPDIDAEEFKTHILPRLRACGDRTTLYCSKNDLALHASRHFNDSIRAGDSSNGPLVAEGLDTIDASDMDTELLGHSYYGNCLKLLSDLRLLIEQNRPPDQRKLEKLFDAPGLPYWIFLD